MPHAEVGSTKYVANQMKSKGLTRLRWYCQVCEKACRDANAFKQHTMSESHVRQMAVVGQDARKHIHDYTQQFKHDFLQLLRTSHGTKSVNANHFYQEYIAKKDHIHMNATHWHSLTEFVKFLGREGICKVSVDEEKGTMEIAWIDNSPENLRRQDALRKKERQDKGDEERERMLIAEQVERARRDAEGRQGAEEDVVDEERTALQREDGQRIKLNFGSKRKEQEPSHTSKVKQEEAPSIAPGEEVGVDTEDSEVVKENTEDSALSTLDPSQGDGTPAPDEKPSVSVSLSGNKPKNVFAAAKKKNALGGGKSTPKPAPQKPMSEAERIMREELERKRRRESMGFGSGGKKLKV